MPLPSVRRIVVGALLALLLLPAVAAASTDQLFEDCQDGRLDKKYSETDYRQALANMPKDLDEYTNCSELIRSAQRGVRGSGGSGPGSNFKNAGGYGALPAGKGGLPLGPDSKPIDPVGIASPAERKEVDSARKGVGLPDTATAVEPSVRGKGLQSARESGAGLPGSLVLVLVLVGVAAVAAAVPLVKGLVLRRGS